MNFSQMKLVDINNYTQKMDNAQLLTILPDLLNDNRLSVQNFAKTLLRQQIKAEKEAARIAQMWQYEQQMQQAGYQRICGTDEVGRGPLAGPVVAAAVILPPTVDLPKINDSKKLSETLREELYQKIIEQALDYAIVEIDNEQIDRLNILQASRLAMARAVDNLQTGADAVLLDGLDNPQITLPHLAIVGGDQKSISIAAASILAKVYRDRLMTEMDQQYPKYQFAKHKGYPTAEHYQALATYGPCAIHRRSFNLKTENKQ